MNARAALGNEQPILSFRDCHAGIVNRLHALAELPQLAAQAARARQVAAQTVALFQDAVLEHHADEEKELFVAVQRSARPGEESDRVAAMVVRLVQEHRRVEAMWRRLEREVRAAARGTAAEIDPAAVEELVTTYLAHAQFEEDHFLPLAQEILSRNGLHMEALGLALHLRHVPQPVPYI